MLKHGLQQNLKRRDGSCRDDQKERLFSAQVVGSGGSHAFVPKLVSGGLFMLRKKGCIAYSAVNIKASLLRTEVKHSQVIHPQDSSGVQSRNI